MLPIDDILITSKENERDVERTIQDLEENIRVFFNAGRLACSEFLFRSCALCTLNLDFQFGHQLVLLLSYPWD